MIARLVTQRACLDFAAQELAGRAGVVLELGLGKGRTFDRLRHLFPDRDIFAFDGDLHCPAALAPDPARLLLGSFADTLPAALARLGRTAALAHADFGTSAGTHDAATAATITPWIGRIVQPDGLVLSDRPLPHGDWTELPLPPATSDWPYFIYRVAS